MSEPVPPPAVSALPSGGRRRAPLVLLVLVLLGAAVGGTWQWLRVRAWESTDDAFVDGNAVVLSPRVDGVVLRSHLRDNRLVARGDRLLELDPAMFDQRVLRARAALAAARKNLESARAGLALSLVTTRAALDEAGSGAALARATLARRRAEVGAASAENERATADVERYRVLYARREASRQLYDRAQATAHIAAARLQAARRVVAEATAGVARAQAHLATARGAPQQLAVRRAEVGLRQAEVEQAAAELRQAELERTYTQIRASHSGRITQRTVHEGSVVRAGQMLALIVYGKPWVSANFKETQLTRMHVGQPVRIEIDAYPGRQFRGRVDSLQAGTGARFSLLPTENATGNFVKVVQRVPVRIRFDPEPGGDTFLALGMSVVPRVRVGAPPFAGALLRELEVLFDNGARAPSARAP